jgi:hypothetical protein
MSITVKNLRPSVLILADAGLRLGPGETAEIAALTPQTQKAIETGRLARLDDGAARGGSNPVQPVVPAPEAAEPAADGDGIDSGGRRASQGTKRPPLDTLRRKAEENAGAAG